MDYKVEVKRRYPDDKYDESEVLEIFRDGESVEKYYEGEPEDNSFCRDWNWVDQQLLQAYKWGIEDGRKEST